jgi:serine-type D-Ala-D-Ala carboxypeptidase (penicillin-binding protein 5/6)
MTPRHAASSRRGSGKTRRYILFGGLAALLVLIGAGAGYQWSRSVPAPVFHASVSEDSLHLPGTAPVLPWPTTGSAALTMEGVGSLGQVGSTQPVPIASITKVMTAYVVLTDHPLSSGDTGPAIPVDAATIAAYQSGLATQQSVVEVTAGESLTELQALEGLLIPSGNNLAVLLADWDAGSTDAFVAKMNNAAQMLGLTSSHFVDVSGLDPGSESTASDLIHLGEAAMAFPAFAQVVAMGETTLPVAGNVINFDYDLGHAGIIGIKTGTDAAAGGCFLFEAQDTVDGKKVTLVGAVLGQQTSSPITAVLSAAVALTQAAFAATAKLPVVTPGQVVGHVVGSWGSSVPVTVAQGPEIVGWPGLALTTKLHVGSLSSNIAPHTRVGVLNIDLDGHKVAVDVRTTGHLQGPSATWRLTRT